MMRRRPRGTLFGNLGGFTNVQLKGVISWFKAAEDLVRRIAGVLA